MSGIEGMPMYLIMFDDTEVQVETMFGEEIASKRFEQVSQNWNAHLFVKVQSNSRDDMCAKSNHVCATPGQQDEKGPLCFCGLKQTKNPHPEAGVPPGYLEVGTVYDCIPCLNKSRRAWSKRANKAEGELIDLRAQVADLLGKMEMMADNSDDGDVVSICRDALSSNAELDSKP
jgi:hypothetical protein